MPYIALQLVGLQVVIGAMGVTGEGWVGDIPLIIAFLILAAFTYSSGLRAPAMIAVVKDTLIYITAFAAVIIIPMQLGGWAKIFAAVPPEKLILVTPGANTTGAYGIYATLALGSALALLLYPHSMTGILSASSGHAVRRNAALLPAYTFVLGLIALLGFFALAAGVDKLPEFAEGFKQFKANFAVPALMLHSFPAWFAGVTFAAIGIGALVPAAIMSIAAANLFTRNVYREFLHGTCSDKQEAQMAKWVSLIVKLGALVFIVFVPLQYAIQLQLLGGIWIIQTLPAMLIGLYTRWFNPWALLIGWAVGTATGTWMAWSVNFAAAFPLQVGAWTFPGYTAFYTRDPQSRRRHRADPGDERDQRQARRQHRGRRLLRLTALAPFYSGRRRAHITCGAAGALPSAAARISRPRTSSARVGTAPSETRIACGASGVTLKASLATTARPRRSTWPMNSARLQPAGSGTHR